MRELVFACPAPSARKRGDGGVGVHLHALHLYQQTWWRTRKRAFIHVPYHQGNAADSGVEDSAMAVTNAAAAPLAGDGEEVVKKKKKKKTKEAAED